jgi:hypothetical protein
MLRYARLGSISDRPSSYYELNLEYRNWFQEAADSGMNLGVIRGMKEKWGTKTKIGANGQKTESPFATGQMEPRGMKEVPELVQVNLEHKWVEGEGFVVKVMDKCRLNSDLIGQEFPGLDFMTLALAMYPESSESDWL